MRDIDLPDPPQDARGRDHETGIAHRAISVLFSRPRASSAGVWQIYVAHFFPVHDLSGEISYLSPPASRIRSTPKKWVSSTSQRPDVPHRPGAAPPDSSVNMDVLPLYIALMLFLPLILWLLKWRADPTLALSVVLYAATWHCDCHMSGVSQRGLGLQSVRLAIVVRVRRLVRGRRPANVAGTFRRGSRWGFRWSGLPVRRVLRHADMVCAAAGHLMPRLLEQWMYPIDKTDLDVLRFHAFSGAGGRYRALAAEGLARIEVAFQAADIVRHIR